MAAFILRNMDGAVNLARKVESSVDSSGSSETGAPDTYSS